MSEYGNQQRKGAVTAAPRCAVCGVRSVFSPCRACNPNNPDMPALDAVEHCAVCGLAMRGRERCRCGGS